MAKTIESTIKMINRRISQIYNYFEGKSTEYMEAKNLVFSYMGGNDFLIREPGVKALSLSGSKKAMQAYTEVFHRDIEELWNALQDMGTVKQLAEEYELYDPENPTKSFDYKDPAIRELILEATTQSYTQKYIDTDLYEKVHAELIEESSKPYDEQDHEYLDGLERVLDYLHRKGSSRDSNIASAWSLFTKIRLDHESKLKNQAENEGEEEVDLGGNP